MYSEDTGATPLQHLEGVHPGGVTQIAFHPLSPTVVFVGSRRSESIQIFDLRDASAPYGELKRKGTTNQRLWFDVDPWGRYLASGDEDGRVKVWNIGDLTQMEPVFDEVLHNGQSRSGLGVDTESRLCWICPATPFPTAFDEHVWITILLATRG